MERRRQRFRFGPRPDQLLAGESDKKLQLSGRGLPRRAIAGAVAIHAAAKLCQRGIRQHRPMGRLRAAVFQADRHQRDQGNAGREVRCCADQENLHLQSRGVRLSRPRSEQTPRADALRPEERQSQPPGRRAAAIRKSANLYRGGRRGDSNQPPLSWARTGENSPPSTTK